MNSDFTRDMISSIGGPTSEPDFGPEPSNPNENVEEDFSLEASDNVTPKTTSHPKPTAQKQAVEGTDYYYEDVPGVGRVMRFTEQPSKNPWGDDPQ